MIDFKLNRKLFIQRVEELRRKDGMRYSEAIVEVCEEFEIDFQDVRDDFIDSTLKEKIKQEAIRNNAVRGPKIRNRLE